MPEEIKVAKDPEATIWGKSVDLGGTYNERVIYRLTIHDPERADLTFELHVHGDGHIHAEPYSAYEYNYLDYENWDEEEDEDDEEYWYADFDEDYYPDEDDEEEGN